MADLRTSRQGTGNQTNIVKLLMTAPAIIRNGFANSITVQPAFLLTTVTCYALKTATVNVGEDATELIV